MPLQAVNKPKDLMSGAVYPEGSGLQELTSPVNISYMLHNIIFGSINLNNPAIFVTKHLT